MRALSVGILAAALLMGCKTTPNPTPDPTPLPVPPKAEAKAADPAEGALRLGAPIEAAAQKVALGDIAKAPEAFTDKTFTTTGTVTAVCQHMGCWMEIKDESSAAHIKMAGHKFFVPKTASGRKARIQGKLVKAESKGSCEGEGHEGMAAQGGGGPGHEKGKGCRAEAEDQLGRPLAKLELVADGVELM